MKNITIIGNVRSDFHIDHRYTLREVMDNINPTKLSNEYMDSYFKFLYKYVDDSIKHGAATGVSTYAELKIVLQDYLNKSRQPSLKFNFAFNEFDQAVSKIDKENWLSKFLRPKITNNIIGKGVNLIEVHEHMCSEHTALIMPHVLNNIKHLDAPTLVCSNQFLTNCHFENGEEHYKISNNFHRHFLRDCKQSGVLYIEYTGQNWICI